MHRGGPSSACSRDSSSRCRAACSSPRSSELAGKDAGPSLKASLGAFLGFLSGTGMKLIVSAVMLYYIIVYI